MKRDLRVFYVNEHTMGTITPEIVAELFSEMIPVDQALFFNELHKINKETKYGFTGFDKLKYISKTAYLTDGGREAMSQIGEYSKKQL